MSCDSLNLPEPYFSSACVRPATVPGTPMPSAWSRDVAGARISHRHGEADRDRGIDGVAASLEPLGADQGRAGLLRHHHAVAADDWLERREFEAALGLRVCGGVRQKEEGGDESASCGVCHVARLVGEKS